MIKVFGCKSKNENELRRIEELSKEKEVFSEYGAEEEHYSCEQDYICKKPIKKSSKFYTYFKDIYESLIEQDVDVDGTENIFYCPSLLELVIENYLPLFPLVSMYFVPCDQLDDLPTTSSIENHWKNVKNHFSKIELSRRYVSVYFPMMLSYFNAQSKEYLMLNKSKAVEKKISKKRKNEITDPFLFHPNFKKVFKLKENANYNQQDGYTKRKIAKKKPGKYVRRELDFNAIQSKFDQL
jgi:hypothetical protein